MAIGVGWAEGSFADTSFVSAAWLSLDVVFTPVLERTHIIAFSDRVQGVY